MSENMMQKYKHRTGVHTSLVITVTQTLHMSQVLNPSISGDKKQKWTLIQKMALIYISCLYRAGMLLKLKPFQILGEIFVWPKIWQIHGTVPPAFLTLTDLLVLDLLYNKSLDFMIFFKTSCREPEY